MAEETEVQSEQSEIAEDFLEDISPENDVSGNEEVKIDDNEPLIAAEEVPTSRSAGSTGNMTVTTTLLSPPTKEIASAAAPLNEEPVCYVDERSKAMDRKAELEALRNRNELTKKKAAFDTDSPMSNSTLASFFLQQKQMKSDVRQNRLGAMNSLNQFRLKECTGIATPRSRYNNNKNDNITALFRKPALSSTTTFADDFFRKQQQFDAEWRRNKEAAFRKMHMYRQQHVHGQTTGESSAGKEEVPGDAAAETTNDSIDQGGTKKEFNVESISTNIDTEIFNSLLLVHAELSQFFTSLPPEALDPDFQSEKSDDINGHVEDSWINNEKKEAESTSSNIADENDPEEDSNKSKHAFGTLGLDQVLDPFTGTRPSFEEAQKEALAAQTGSPPKKTCPLTDLAIEGFNTLTFVGGANDQQVMMVQHVVENLPTDEAAVEPSSPEKDDSTVSSIGSSLDGSVDRNSLEGGQSSCSSLSTFWKEDAPPSEEAFAALLTCDSEQYIPNLHSTRGHCERCFSLASETERAKFLDEGRHVRIMIVRGGCTRSCTAFPRGEDDPPVRLCRKCYFDTHRPPRKSTDGRDLFNKSITSPTPSRR